MPLYCTRTEEEDTVHVQGLRKKRKGYINTKTFGTFLTLRMYYMLLIYNIIHIIVNFINYDEE